MKKYLLAFLLLPVLSFAQEDTLFTVGDVQLEAPNTFKSSDVFPGLLHTATLSSILVQEYETAYQLIDQAQTAENFASQGVTMISKEAIADKGFLYHLSFTTKGMDFERLMFIGGDVDHSFVIMGNFPAVVKEEMLPVIKNVLLSASFK